MKMFNLIYFLVSLCRLFAIKFTDPIEKSSLENIYVENGGSNWNWKSNNPNGQIWNFSTDPCVDSWEGIKCINIISSSYLHINSILLISFNVTGTLMPDLRNFFYLEHLDLRRNRIDGTLIPELYDLFNLKYLDLSINFLSGSLSSNISRLASLKQLMLYSNNFNGTIPNEIYSLSNLTSLHLFNNSFHGTISGNLTLLNNLSILDFGSNFLTGNLPDLSDMPSFYHYDISYNFLHGTIPLSLCELRSLKVVFFMSNYFNHSIPSCLSNLQSLTNLDMGNNYLSGTIPEGLNALKNLTNLVFLVNSLTGSIPINITGLKVFDTSFNMLNGTLSSSFSKMEDLQIFIVQGNFLSGSFPKGIEQLKYLRVLNLFNNSFSGFLPPSFQNMSSLIFFELGYNKFSGQIPSFLNLSKLIYFDISYNNFHGTIPADISSAKNLLIIYIEFNFIHGTIPNNLYPLSRLRIFTMFNNLLNGTLPSSLGSLPNLSSIELSSNPISGTIPNEYANLVHLVALYTENNQLTGSIPPFKYRLARLSLENNKLTGRIPSSIGHISTLNVLKLNKNLLTGSIPKTFSNLTNLSILQLQLNQLSGNLDRIFDPSNQNILSQIDLSNNQFSGELPSNLLGLPSLKTLAAVQNCFHGTIPSSICEAKNLTILAMDGLTASTSCLHYFWDPLHVTVGFISNRMRGSIPSCIWDLHNLTTIHLSGNGFTGKLEGISENYYEYSQLKDLSLSHNILSGKIPQGLQKISYISLDLSYNKFKGHVDSMEFFNRTSGRIESDQRVSSNSSIYLDVNRLSGNLPALFQDIANINVLTGNLFSCSNSHPSPKHDPSYSNYICGSDEFYRSLIVFGCLLAIIIFIILFTYYIGMKVYLMHKGKIINMINCISYSIAFVWLIGANLVMEAGTPTNPNFFSQVSKNYGNLFRYISSLSIIQHLFIFITLYSLLVCMPLYITFYTVWGDSSSTHVDRYGWVVSSVFLTGNNAAIVFFIVWLIPITYLTFYVFLKFDSLEKLDIDLISESDDSFISSTYNALYASHEEESNNTVLKKIELNSLSSGQNSVNRDESDDDIEGLEKKKKRKINTETNSVDSVAPKSLSLSFFSYSISLQQADRSFFYYAIVFLLNCSFSLFYNCGYVILLTSSNISSDSKILLQIFTACFKLFWNIIIVRLVIDQLPRNSYTVGFHVSLLLFNSLFAPCLASSFTDSLCFKDFFTGSGTITTKYSYNTCLDPFSLLNPNTFEVYYNCIHVFNEIYQTEFNPTFIYYYACGSNLLISYIPVYIYSYGILLALVPVIYYSLATINISLVPSFLVKHIIGIARPQNKGSIKFLRIFRSNSIQALLIQHIVVALTFGINGPPLALVCLILVIIECFMWQLLIIRYIKYDSQGNPFYRNIDLESTELQTYSSDSIKLLEDLSSQEYQNEKKKLIELNSICADSWNGLKHAIWVIFTCALLFYTFLLFDMVGDESGYRSTIWLLVLCPVVLIVYRLFFNSFIKIIKEYFPRKRKT